MDTFYLTFALFSISFTIRYIYNKNDQNATGRILRGFFDLAALSFGALLLYSLLPDITLQIMSKM